MRSRNGKNQRKDAYTVYRSYSFIDKDPVIDVLRGLVQDSGHSYAKLSAEADVSATTFSNWFGGTTRRPQFATIVATFRALGYDVEITHRRAYSASGIRLTK